VSQNQRDVLQNGNDDGVGYVIISSRASAGSAKERVRGSNYAGIRTDRQRGPLQSYLVPTSGMLVSVCGLVSWCRARSDLVLECLQS
jgi:hypothetical protein